MNLRLATCRDCLGTIRWLEISKADGTRGPCPVRPDPFHVRPLDDGEEPQEGRKLRAGYTETGRYIRGYEVPTDKATTELWESHRAVCPASERKAS